MNSESPLMTADEFLRRHIDESGVELVDGRVVWLPPTGARHGEVCGNVVGLIGGYVKSHRLGRAGCNHVFVRTRKNPDGCRGADVLFVSYETLPANIPTPRGELTPPLELVIEVQSPSDTVKSMMNKAMEYINAGVRIVVILDPDEELAAVFRADEYPQRFHNGDTFTLPDVLPGFAVPVKAFFE